MVVFNKKNGVIPVNHVALSPGPNLLNKQHSKQILENGGEEILENHPMLKIMSDDSKKPIHKTSDLKSKDIIDQINQTWYIRGLMEMENQERKNENGPRPEVLFAIEEQKKRVQVKGQNASNAEVNYSNNSGRR